MMPRRYVPEFRNLCRAWRYEEEEEEEKAFSFDLNIAREFGYSNQAPSKQAPPSTHVKWSKICRFVATSSHTSMKSFIAKLDGRAKSCEHGVVICMFLKSGVRSWYLTSWRWCLFFACCWTWGVCSWFVHNEDDGRFSLAYFLNTLVFVLCMVFLKMLFVLCIFINMTMFVHFMFWRLCLFILCMFMKMMAFVLCLCVMLMMVFCRLHVLEDDDLVCITILEGGACSLFGNLHLLEWGLS